MANAGYDVSKVDGLEAITETEKKKVRVNAFGELEVSSGIYEDNHFNLRNIFVADWNDLFETNFVNLDSIEFYNSAKEGLKEERDANKNLAESNIYKFFNDEVYGPKWAWLLDFMELHTDSATECGRQLDAIRGDGTNEDFLLYHSDHLIYSIANFFNQSDDFGYGDAIDFTEPECYEDVAEINNTIFIDMNEHDFCDVGESLEVPEAPEEKEGYNFINYKVDDVELNPGDLYVIEEDVVIEAVYEAIPYSVKFYDGDTDLDMDESYTIEGQLLLPKPSDEELFKGWYDNKDFAGEPITEIDVGSTGDKVFYARWELKENLIMFNGNGSTSGSMAEQKIKEGESAALIENAFIKTGYDFAGWSTTADGEVVYKDQASYNMGENDIYTLYAKWDPKEYKLALGSKEGIKSIIVKRGNETLKDGDSIFYDESLTISGTKVDGYNDPLGSTVTVKKAITASEHITAGSLITYTITFSSYGFTNRDAMMTAFLKDFYKLVKSLNRLTNNESENTFIHGSGGFNGTYDSYTSLLRVMGDPSIRPNTIGFINQPAYNHWVPVIDLMDEYSKLQSGSAGFWANNDVAVARFKQFVKGENPFGTAKQADVNRITSTIPNSLGKVSMTYNCTQAVTLPNLTGLYFKGWYTGANGSGTKVTSLAKGSTGNKTYYAKMNTLFESFCEDYHNHYKQPGKSAAILVSNFGDHSYITLNENWSKQKEIFTIHSNRWKWLEDFIVSKANEGFPNLYERLTEDSWRMTVTWRANIHCFFNKTKGDYSDTIYTIGSDPGSNLWFVHNYTEFHYHV